MRSALADGREAVGDDEGGAAREQPPRPRSIRRSVPMSTRRRGLVEDQDAGGRRAGPGRTRRAGAGRARAGRRARRPRCRSRRAARTRTSSAPTAAAAASISARDAVGRPNAMLSAIEPAKRKPSCGTMPSCARSDALRDLAQVVPVDRDPALARVVEAREQLGDRRLAGARVRRRARRSSRPGRRGRSRAARPAGLRSRSGRARSGRGRGSRAGLARPARRRCSGSSSSTVVIRSRAAVAEQERVVELGELLHRVEEVREVEREGEQRADRQLPSTTSQPPTPRTIAVATDDRMSTPGSRRPLRTTVS